MAKSNLPTPSKRRSELIDILAARHFWDRPALWASGMPGAKIIKQYERLLNRPSERWDQYDWRAIAMALAARIEADIKRRGRKPEQRSNIAALSYQATLEIENARSQGKRLARRKAIQQIYEASLRRHGRANYRLTKTVLDTLCKQERRFRERT